MKGALSVAALALIWAGCLVLLGAAARVAWRLLGLGWGLL